MWVWLVQAAFVCWLLASLLFLWKKNSREYNHVPIEQSKFIILAKQYVFARNGNVMSIFDIRYVFFFLSLASFLFKCQNFFFSCHVSKDVSRSDGYHKILKHLEEQQWLLCRFYTLETILAHLKRCQFRIRDDLTLLAKAKARLTSRWAESPTSPATAPLRVSQLDGKNVLILGVLMLAAHSFTASPPIGWSGLNFASLQPGVFSASRIAALILCWLLAANLCQGRRKRFTLAVWKISSWKVKRC